MDAVESIELMDLTRSTLKDDHISSCAFITPEEAIKDLIGLSWIECSVTSFKTLNSVNYDSMNLQIANNIASATKSESRKKQPKLRTKALKDQVDLDGKECSVTLFKPPNSNSQPKKKRPKKVPTLMEGTESACSSAIDDHCTAKGKSGDCATGGQLSSSSSMVITGPIV